MTAGAPECTRGCRGVWPAVAVAVAALAAAIVFAVVLTRGGAFELYAQRLTATDSNALLRVDETIAMHRAFLSTGVWLALILFGVTAGVCLFAEILHHVRARR